MFLNVNINPVSESVADLRLNAVTNQALVKYQGSEKVYLYDNVSFDAILDFVTGEFESVGKFVNAYCKPMMTTICN
jgi:DNA polymerase II small subunit/DNA polymerase delta subunit B